MDYLDFQVDGAGPTAGIFTVTSWLQSIGTLMLLSVIGVCIVFGVVAFGYWALQLFQEKPMGNRTLSFVHSYGHRHSYAGRSGLARTHGSHSNWAHKVRY